MLVVPAVRVEEGAPHGALQGEAAPVATRHEAGLATEWVMRTRCRPSSSKAHRPTRSVAGTMAPLPRPRAAASTGFHRFRPPGRGPRCRSGRPPGRPRGRRPRSRPVRSANGTGTRRPSRRLPLPSGGRFGSSGRCPGPGRRRSGRARPTVPRGAGAAHREARTRAASGRAAGRAGPRGVSIRSSVHDAARAGPPVGWWCGRGQWVGAGTGVGASCGAGAGSVPGSGEVFSSVSICRVKPKKYVATKPTR